MSKDLVARLQEIQAQAWAPVQEQLKENQRKWAAAAVARWEEECAFWEGTGVPIPESTRQKFIVELAKARAALAALD